MVKGRRANRPAAEALALLMRPKETGYPRQPAPFLGQTSRSKITCLSNCKPLAGNGLCLRPGRLLSRRRVFRTAGVDDGGHGHAESAGYRPPACPVRAQALRLVAPEYALWASERDSFGFGSAHSGPDALADGLRPGGGSAGTTFSSTESAPKSVITCMAGFAGARRPHPPGGRVAIPAAFR